MFLLREGPTLLNVLQGPSYPPVKGPGVGRTLESQSELLVINPPVVEDWGDLVVDQVPLYVTLQHNLIGRKRSHLHRVIQQVTIASGSTYEDINHMTV